MKTPRTVAMSFWLPMLAAALGGWGALRSGAPAVPAPSCAVVGLVDVQRLMKGSSELKARAADLKAKADARQKELDAVGDLRSRLKAELDLLRLDAPERPEKYASLIEADAQYKAKEQVQTRLNQLDEGRAFGAAYTGALATISRVAAKDGYTLVLLDDRAISLPTFATGDEVSGVILNKRILYADHAADITERIIIEMNNEYEAPAARTGK